MKAIVIKSNVYFNVKFDALFDCLIPLSISVNVDDSKGVVYMYFSSDSNLTKVSNCLFIAGILHRVILI